MSTPATTVVVIPIRSFEVTKSRLADALTHDERRRLTQAMAARVIAAAGALPVRVVTDDPEVAAWASGHGAEALRPDVAGLNPAVTAALAQLAAEGHSRVIIAHADLPAATNLAAADQPGVCIAPDTNRDGSNVMCVPTDAGFTFAYGPGSFQRHLDEARRLGLHCTIIEEPGLAWDIDDPTDLPTDWRNLIADIPVGPESEPT